MMKVLPDIERTIHMSTYNKYMSPSNEAKITLFKWVFPITLLTYCVK